MEPFTYYVDTALDLFVDWYRHYTRNVQGRRFPTDKDGEYVTLEPAQAEYGFQRVEPRTWGTAPLYLAMHGTLWTQNGQDIVTPYSPYGPISLELLSIADGRIQVLGKCTHPALSGYFQDLKGAIGRPYPETGFIETRWASYPNGQLATSTPDLAAVPLGANVIVQGNKSRLTKMQQLAVVQGWIKVEKDKTQEGYCADLRESGIQIEPRTLRSWLFKYKRDYYS